MKNPRILWLLLWLATFGTAPFVDAAPKDISQITMQRTWCYGACPIDSLTLNADGGASYSGVRNVPRLGRYSGKIVAERFERLATWLEAENFFEFRPQIGAGNIDASDLIVSVERDGLPYIVAFRSGGNELLKREMESTITGAAAEIEWQKDEMASASGVRGVARRPLTESEAFGLRDRQPPVTSLPMRFALVSIYPLADSKQEVSTITDQEGRFEFFLPPNRYYLSASDFNFSRAFNADAPLYLASSQTIGVEAAKFAPATIRFENKKPVRR